MSVKEMIKNEIDKLPEGLLTEVYDFIQFLERILSSLLCKFSQRLYSQRFSWFLIKLQFSQVLILLCLKELPLPPSPPLYHVL